MKKKLIYILVFIIGFVLYFSISIWNDYRVKDLVDVMDAEEIESIHYRKFPLENNIIKFNREMSDPESI